MNSSDFIVDLPASELAAIESLTQQLGRQLFAQLDHHAVHFWQRRWWDDRLLAWSMRDEGVKVQLFRFVDVLPMLDSSDAVVEHLVEYLAPVAEKLPSSARVSLGVARRFPFTRAAVARAAKLSAADFARRFIAGTNSREVLAAARRQRELRRAFTLDILGEAVTSEAEAERFFQAYLRLLEETAPTVNGWPEAPQIDRAQGRALPRTNLSIKLSALDSQFDAIDRTGATERVAARLRELLRAAARHKAFINIDMESYEKKDITLHIFRTVLAEPEFNARDDVGIVIQCYLRDSGRDLASLRDWAAQRGAPVWVRLVKGAYWDYETIHARANDWPIPVFQKKWESDANFERLTRFAMANWRHIAPALGSHNLRSLAAGIAAAQHLGVPDDAYEVQMLYGMADTEKQALVNFGSRLRVYMPYGELIPGMAYLVRRLLENTSNDSFLRASVMEGVSPEELLQSPAAAEEELKKDSEPRSDESRKAEEPENMSGYLQKFRNEPPVNFALDENRAAMTKALEEVRGQLGKHWPLVIGGREVDTHVRSESRDPSRTERLIGSVAMADVRHVEQAVAAAKAAQPAWFALGVEKRAAFLRRAAAAMRGRRFELSAWEVFECGKPWREATGDIDEAIDFCEYYAAGALDMAAAHSLELPGESNRFEFLPRGVAAVIAPWNFPLAILTGMTVAALVTGNAVIMKPAEQSPMMAALLMQIFSQLEFPPGVLNFLPGTGETVGAALVEQHDVAMIAFTGSRAVGLAINARAAAASTTAPQVKRVIAEMGGKNAIIVDDDADLDEAVLGVVKSAFGYVGQKCSACSRVVVHEQVYDAFVARLVEATRSLKVGLAEDPATSIGPVIDRASLEKVQKYIELGRQEGRVVLAGNVGELSQHGHFIGPHIFADIPAGARLAQEEVFGPVLAVIKVANFDEALRVANGTEYALTGGIFSRSPAHLERAEREFLVGNLYLNRSITGALVGRQPFGGFRMSGIGSKAGGPDYLLQFVIPRTITENTLRRGFAPVESAGE